MKYAGDFDGTQLLSTTCRLGKHAACIAVVACRYMCLQLCTPELQVRYQGSSATVCSYGYSTGDAHGTCTGAKAD